MHARNNCPQFKRAARLNCGQLIADVKTVRTVPVVLQFVWHYIDLVNRMSFLAYCMDAGDGQTVGLNVYTRSATSSSRHQWRRMKAADAANASGVDDAAVVI